MMEIKPNRKLLTKQWLILSTVSLLLTLVGLLLQILIPLDEGITAQQVAVILWPIAVGLILLLWAVVAPIITLWIRRNS